jgi:aminopeptidase N
VTTNPGAETATFTVPQQLAEGPVTIEVTYNGILNDKLRGFYLSEANGRKYAVSQMEATDARRAFPSFDEPAFKATFDISLMVDRGDVAISNGKVVSDTPGPEPGKHTVTFSRTQKMSTYLVALLVGDFSCRDGSSEGTPIRVCSTPDKRELTGFALEAAIQQLKFYNDYFGIKYPFGKLDIIAIPDFAAGAMENAGAITFRERMLLPGGSIAGFKTVATVLSHEIAHQWFGDLVTMKWWDDIWLNEGFANWMEHKVTGKIDPTDRDDLADLDMRNGALGADALVSARRIRQPIETPDDIATAFDGITYNKGASVLNMFERYVGAAAFQQGVREYLKSRAFGNATSKDFVAAIANAAGGKYGDIEAAFATFLDRPGAPEITATIACNGAPRVQLSQKRYLPAGAPTPPPQGPWSVPVCVAFDDHGKRGEACTLLTTETGSLALPAKSCPRWVMPNTDGRSYYVMAYTQQQIATLRD